MRNFLRDIFFNIVLLFRARTVSDADVAVYFDMIAGTSEMNPNLKTII